MFKDDYKSANNQITASDDLKRRTLERINKPKETQFNSFMRYGLVCASFLFVVATFPILQNLDELENDKSRPLMATGPSGEAIPQTGIDQFDFEGNSQPTDQPAKSKDINAFNSVENKVESNDKKLDLPKPEESLQMPLENIQKPKEEVIEVEPKINQKITLFASPRPTDIININELNNFVTLSKPPNFTDKEKFYEEQWDIKKITEYLGCSSTPSYLPPDLTISLPDEQTPTQRVVFNKDGTIAYDTFSLSFLEPQLTKEVNPLRRTLSISVAKDKLPTDCSLYMKDDAPTSTIKGCELRIGMFTLPYEYDENKEPTKYANKYVAEFIFNNVGYRIIADNLTQKEFTDVISSIIMPIPN